MQAMIASRSRWVNFEKAIPRGLGHQAEVGTE